MKKYMFILFVAVIAMSGHSQNYHKLIRTGTYWDEYFVVLPEMCYTAIIRYSFTDGDTLLGGVSYKMNKIYQFQSVNPGPLCPPFVIDTVPYISLSFLREDTLARKVFVYCEGCTPTDQLLYDFSLGIGDTLQSLSQTLYGEPLVLTSLDTVTLLNGELRKRFGFSDSPDQLYYIESLGGAQGLDRSIVPGIESYGGFFCISQNGMNLWGDHCNNYFVGSDEKKSYVFLLYPNPAHDFITIHLSKTNPETDFTLLTMSGKEIIKEKFNQYDNLISIEQLTPGLYFYQLKSDRFCKQDKIIIF
jgi:hypothetical protein